MHESSFFHVSSVHAVKMGAVEPIERHAAWVWGGLPSPSALRAWFTDEKIVVDAFKVAVHCQKIYI